MSHHMVNIEDLRKCRDDVAGKVQEIGSALAAMNGRLGETTFEGENAGRFADGMNATVVAFNTAQNQNLQNILETVRHNMNVVVRKLGGDGFGEVSVDQLVNQHEAKAKGLGNNEAYDADTDSMGELKGDIDLHMKSIVGMYEEIPQIIARSAWIGPEKDATFEDVNGQVNATVVPDIDSASSEMQTSLQEQIDSLAGGAAPAGVQ